MWPSIFVTAVFFKVTSLQAGTEREGGAAAGGGGGGPRELADRERARLTARQS